jgi:aminoglycoside phosphotransferase (APT) family kinase protein
LEDADRLYGAVAGRLGSALRYRIEAFLGSAPPAGDFPRVFSHNDLGSEHVLIDAGTVTGVIDWGDAAIVDPAYDFGLLLRDLGSGGFEAALAAYSRPVAGLRERAWFYARCAVLEDLAFDLSPPRLDAAAWLFTAPSG